MAELNAAWTAASQDIYNAQAAGAGQPGSGQQESSNGQSGGTGSHAASEKTPEDNVTDVPYEEVK